MVAKHNTFCGKEFVFLSSLTSLINHHHFNRPSIFNKYELLRQKIQAGTLSWRRHNSVHQVPWKGLHSYKNYLLPKLGRDSKIPKNRILSVCVCLTKMPFLYTFSESYDQGLTDLFGHYWWWETRFTIQNICLLKAMMKSLLWFLLLILLVLLCESVVQFFPRPILNFEWTDAVTEGQARIDGQDTAAGRGWKGEYLSYIIFDDDHQNNSSSWNATIGRGWKGEDETMIIFPIRDVLIRWSLIKICIGTRICHEQLKWLCGGTSSF